MHICVYTCLCMMTHMESSVHTRVRWHICEVRWFAYVCMCTYVYNGIHVESGVQARVWWHTHGSMWVCMHVYDCTHMELGGNAKGLVLCIPHMGHSYWIYLVKIEDKSFWYIFHPNLPILKLKEWFFLTKYFNTYFVDLSWSCEHLSTVKIPLKGNREYHTWHSEHIVWDLVTTTYLNFNIAVISVEEI